MSSRTERCSGCELLLSVPLQAQVVRCAACNTVTKFRSSSYHNSWGSNGNNWQSITGMYGYYKNKIFSGLGHTYTTGSGSGTNYNYSFLSSLSRPLSTPASPYGRKRAVLCGISYIGKSYRLKGTINDVRCMKYFLVHNFGYPHDSILMLTEEETHPSKIPTKQNMRTALRWLVEGCRSGDSLVFHYSGHGSRQRDYDGDEVDGQDEALCPLDHEVAGKIIDDEINGTIVNPLPHGAKLHAIIDACYSGTVLDLPFVCRMNRDVSYYWEDHRVARCYKGTSGGLAISFSACDDHQTTTDSNAFTGNNTMTGAMTYSFIKASLSEPGSTYGRLLNSMRYSIGESKPGIRLSGPIISLLNKIVFNSDSSQEPQLSSSETFDIYSTKFTL